jgi:hypothetical protein
MFELISEFLTVRMASVREEYGVNPVWFLLLYFGTVPLFWASIVYTVRFYRESKPLWLPLTGLILSQFACYIYLISAGRNLPAWIYIVIAAIIGWGLLRSWSKIRKKVRIERDKSLIGEPQAIKSVNRQHPPQTGHPEQ